MPDKASFEPPAKRAAPAPAAPPRLIEATDPALPHPRVRHARNRYHRRYLDPVGHPMTGTVTITRRGLAHTDGDVVIPTSPARVELADGHLDVQLAPGEYELAAQLRTRDGVGVVHKDVVTVAPDA